MTAAPPPFREFLLQIAARFGYAARGAVYLLTGVFAILASFEVRSASTGTGGALAEAAQWPLGRVWLALAGAGLLAFAGWRFVQALFDADRKGWDRKALALRAGKGLSGILYLGLALTAFELLDELEDLNEEAETRREAAEILALPYGQWLLLGVAAAVLVAAAGNLLKAASHDFRKELWCPPRTQRWAVWAGRAGYAARGAVFLVLALFLALAALSGDASSVRSIGGALQALERQPFGSAVVAAIGVGFLAFGAYGLLQARYRSIDVPKPLG